VNWKLLQCLKGAAAAKSRRATQAAGRASAPSRSRPPKWKLQAVVGGLMVAVLSETTVARCR
jgi:hypothetical protein